MSGRSETIRDYSVAISAAGTVLAIVVTGAKLWIDSGQSANSLDREYVELAISVLREAPDEEGSEAPLRSWAVAMLDASSPVPLSPELQEGLLDGAAPLVLPSASAREILEARAGVIESFNSIFETACPAPGEGTRANPTASYDVCRAWLIDAVGDRCANPDTPQEIIICGP